MAIKFIKSLYIKSKIYVKAYLINLPSRLRGIYEATIKFIKFYRSKMPLAQKLNLVVSKSGLNKFTTFQALGCETHTKSPLLLR